jgi:hypothetical protein
MKRGVQLHFVRSGARTRTLNNWTRTSCVANYTTPEGLGKPTRDAEDIASVHACQSNHEWKMRNPMMRPTPTSNVSFK